VLRSHHSGSRGVALALAAFVGVSLSGCASLGSYVWVDDYRDPQASAEIGPYLLAPGDVIQVRVFLQEGLSARARVRSDGKISLPFLNDVQAAGYEPVALAKQVAVRLKDFVNSPMVTISVEEPRQLQILVAGEVARPGVVQTAPESGLLAALVLAGGLTDFAHDDRIFVLRPGNRTEATALRIRFDYPTLLRGRGHSSQFRLRTGDQVVVE
jgi:polysaccharide export outer membrane protein